MTITDKQIEAALWALQKAGLIPTPAVMRAALEAAEAAAWQDIATAPRDGADFLSVSEDNKSKPHETRFLSPGPYTTENGKNTQGERRYQWPDGFYWSGYNGFVGPVDPTRWRHLPQPPKETT